LPRRRTAGALNSGPGNGWNEPRHDGTHRTLGAHAVHPTAVEGSRDDSTTGASVRAPRPHVSIAPRSITLSPTWTRRETMAGTDGGEMRLSRAVARPPVLRRRRLPQADAGPVGDRSRRARTRPVLGPRLRLLQPEAVLQRTTTSSGTGHEITGRSTQAVMDNVLGANTGRATGPVERSKKESGCVSE